MRPILSGGPSFLCVAVITASMKLSGKIFTVQHSPYLVSKFELGRPMSVEKMAGNIIVMNNNYYEYEKRQ